MEKHIMHNELFGHKKLMDKIMIKSDRKKSKKLQKVIKLLTLNYNRF